MSGQMHVQSTGDQGLDAMMMAAPAAPVPEEAALDPAILEAKFEALLDQGLVDAALEEMTISEEEQTMVGEQLASMAELETATATWTVDSLVTATLGTMVEEPMSEEIIGDELEGSEGESSEVEGNEESLLSKMAGKTKHNIISVEGEVELTGKQAGSNPTLKRDQVGVDSMLNDFPEGWETLLDEQPDGGALQVEPEFIKVETSDAPTELVVDKSKAQAVKESSAPALPFEDQSSDLSQKQESGESKLLQTMKASAAENQTSHDTMIDDLSFQTTLKITATQGAPKLNLTNSIQMLNAMNEVQKQSVIKSFSHDTLQGLKGKEERLKIDLNPPELGRVQVLVQRSGDQVHARIVIADAQLGEFFQEHIDQIRKNIESSGMRLGNFSLEVGQQPEAEQQKDIEEDSWSEDSSNKTGSKDGTAKVNQPTTNNSTKSSKVDMLI